MIQAIETRYGGCKFRSRLEARWAVFFDAMKIKWSYEPQGFETDDEMYLPDFHLPQSNTWVEVKGSDEMLKKDRNRLEAILDYSSPIPGIQNSDGDPGGAGLLILGEVPNPDVWGVYLHTIIRHDHGLRERWARFWNHGRVEVLNQRTEEFVGLFFNPYKEPEWTTEAVHVPTALASQTVLDAYRAARYARFEHGQCG